MLYCGTGSAVGNATCYGIDCSRLQPKWERDISYPSIPSQRPMHLPAQTVKAFSQGESSRSLGITTVLFIAKLKQRVKLCLHSPMSSWLVKGELFFYFTVIKRISVVAVFFVFNFTAVIYTYICMHIIHFHLFHQVHIYWNWLQEQFCNLSFYTLCVLSV